MQVLHPIIFYRTGYNRILNERFAPFLIPFTCNSKVIFV